MNETLGKFLEESKDFREISDCLDRTGSKVRSITYDSSGNTIVELEIPVVPGLLSVDLEDKYEVKAVIDDDSGGVGFIDQLIESLQEKYPADEDFVEQSDWGG